MFEKWNGTQNIVPVCLSGFCFGVVCIRFFPFIPSQGIFATFLIVALGFAIRTRYLICRAAVFWVTGICWAGLQVAALQSVTIPKTLEKVDLEVVGVITGQIKSSGRAKQFNFKVISLQFQQRVLPNPGRIQLSSYDREAEFEPGERWQFTVRLKRPRSLVNPGMGFDYAAWLMSQGVTAKGYIVNGSARRIRIPETSFFQNFAPIQSARRGFDTFLNSLPLAVSQRAVFGALSVGIREQMDTATWQVLRDTGTAHLVAISGLHIGLVALFAGVLGGVVWKLISRYTNRITMQDFKWCFALMAAIIYALFAGLTIPTQRAVSMLAIAALVIFLRKSMGPGALISITLCAVLVVNPLAPFSSSFWLSFSAVIVLVFGLLYDYRSADKHAESASFGFSVVFALLRKWVKVQCWLFVAMIPVFAIGFHQISMVAPLANLVAVPIVGMIIVPLVLASLIGWCFGFFTFAVLTIELASFLFQFVWKYLSWLSTNPLATWKFGAPEEISVVLASIGLMILIGGRHLPYRSLGVIWFLPLFTAGPPVLAKGEFQYTLLDVGQGLASVVKTANRVMVFDTGAAYPSGFDLGEAVVVPFIRSQNISNIDLLLISHGDNDHAGGARAVDREFTVQQLLASDTESNLLPGSARPCQKGQRWNWDDVTFEVLWPASGADNRGNNASCVVRVSSRFGSLLLTGDIERTAEQQLVSHSQDKLAADVLQVPHHGSKTSSTSAFIRSVDPAIALVGNGYLNRFSHPAAEINERYRDADIPLLSAAEHGAIQVHFSPSGTHVMGERTRVPRFWRDRPPEKEQIYLLQPIAKTHSDILPAG